MSNRKSYQELDVWKQSRILVKIIYELTKTFPSEEQFGLKTQMRRSAVSVPSNIAEGCGRNHSKDSTQFFFIARGSLYELETQLILAFDLNYLAQEDFELGESQVTRCLKLLNGFINYFQSNTGNGQRTTVNEILINYGDNS